MYGEFILVFECMIKFDSCEFVNFDIIYMLVNDVYIVVFYGCNIFDECYDNVCLNIGDYIL